MQLDRPILELIGFKNKLRTDRNKVEDNRKDFANAIQCLKKTTGFVQGSSLEDESADFVLLPTSTLANTNSTLIGSNLAPLVGGASLIGPSWGGSNKLTVWVRMRSLEHFTLMANTPNRYRIREYFLNLNRMVANYVLYQEQYLHEQATLKLADVVQLQEQRFEAQTEVVHLQTEQLKVMAKLMAQEAESKVLPVQSEYLKQQFVVLRDKEQVGFYEIIRGQKGYVQQQLLKKQKTKEVVKVITQYNNPINLGNRLTEFIQQTMEFQKPYFKKSNNQIELMNGATEEGLLLVLDSLVSERCSVANVVSDLYTPIFIDI